MVLNFNYFLCYLSSSKKGFFFNLQLTEKLLKKAVWN